MRQHRQSTVLPFLVRANRSTVKLHTRFPPQMSRPLRRANFLGTILLLERSSYLPLDCPPLNTAIAFVTLFSPPKSAFLCAFWCVHSTRLRVSRVLTLMPRA